VKHIILLLLLLLLLQGLILPYSPAYVCKLDAVAVLLR
jgi:hypothetical protein